MSDELKRLLDEAQPDHKDNGKPLECRLCPLYDAPGPVPGEGPKDAKLVLLGEAPGETEVIIKRPFVGGSGRVLNRMLGEAKIARSQCYVTNVVKCRPTVVTHEGKTKDRPPSPTEIECCAPFLIAELEAVKPNLILGLGGTAALALKGDNKISKHRGVPFPTQFGKALLSYHPAGLMRQQNLFPLALRDLALAAEESKSPELIRTEYSIITNARASTTGSDLLTRARLAGFATKDLETTGFNPRTTQIICISITTQSDASEVYAWNDDTKRIVHDLWVDPTIEHVGQNCEDFDWWYLVEKNGWEEAPAGRSFDTLLAFHLIKSDLKKDLGTLGSVYTDMEYWKDEGKGGWKKPSEHVEGSNLFRYCGKDGIGTTQSYLVQKKQLKELDLEDLFYKNVMPLQPILRRLRRRGVKKDEVKAALWAEGLRQAADQNEELLRRELGRQDLNINSAPQMIDLLYNVLKLPPQYLVDRNKGSRLTANDEAMENLARITSNPVFRKVNEIRSARKWASTYCEAETDENGFMHTHFGCAKAANGRLNSFDPALQNWPEDLRELVIPDSPDHIFLACDWSQIEWRIAMVRSADRAGLEMMVADVDNHNVTAMECFSIPESKVNEMVNASMTYRHASKFIVYGLGYGRQAPSIAKQLGREQNWVRGFIYRYFAKHAQYAAYRNWEEEFVRKNNYLKNPWKRRRWWYSMNLPELYNFYPSSTAADMMYLVIPTVESQLPSGATLRLTVHDELVVCSPRDAKTVQQSAQCLRENMSRKWMEVTDDSIDSAAVKKYYPSGWWCPSDLSLGYTWKDCKNKEFQKTLGKQLKKEYGL